MVNRFKNKRRKKLEQSGYGRADGWEVEINAVKIGIFTKPTFEDMYWYSYEFVLINPLFFIFRGILVE